MHKKHHKLIFNNNNFAMKQHQVEKTQNCFRLKQHDLSLHQAKQIATNVVKWLQSTDCVRW